MGLLEELLKYSKTHGTAVIVVLVGVILAGSVGGGLWIQQLRSALGEQESLVAERVALIEERYRNRYSEIYQRVELLHYDVIEVTRRAQEHGERLTSISHELAELSGTPGLESSARQRLPALSDTLSLVALEMNRDFSSLGNAVQLAYNELEFARGYVYPPAGGGPPLFLILVLLALAAVGLLLFIWLLWKLGSRVSRKVP